MNSCLICNGLGYIIKEGTQFAEAIKCSCLSQCLKCNNSKYQKIVINNYVFYKKCDCANLDNRIKLFNNARIPKKFYNKTLENYEHKGGNQGFIRMELLTFRKKFPLEKKGLLLFGLPGVGKTHLLVSIISFFTLELGISCIFVDYFQLLQNIKSSFQEGEGEERIIDEIVENEIIALDELGKGRGSEWELNVLDNIISKIYNGNKILLVTTNFFPKNYKSQLFIDADSLEDRVGERIFSRLCELCSFYLVDGPDYRKFNF